MASQDFPERHYTNNISRSYGMGVWSMMFRELLGARDLILILAGRNISVKYRQSLLSYLWIIIPPVFAVLLFSFMVNHKIINVGNTPLPYLSYALLNISIWLLFSNALISATKSLVDAGSLVTRVNFPKIAMVISSISDSLLELVVRLSAVAFVFFIQGVNIDVGVLFVPILLIPLILMALGLGLIFSILNLVIRDTANLLGIIMTIGMFLTPVLYPPPRLEPFVYINMFNPVSTILENIQSVIVTGTFSNIPMLAISSVLSLLVFLIGWRIFNLTMPRISERA